MSAIILQVYVKDYKGIAYCELMRDFKGILLVSMHIHV